MPAPTRFQVVQVNNQGWRETEESLNDVASREDVAEIVGWDTASCKKSRTSNLIIEYLPTEEA